MEGERLQISLRSLLVFTGICAVYLAIIFAVPSAVGYYSLAVISTLIPGGLVAGIVYGSKSARAFCIGCAAAFASTAFYEINSGNSLAMAVATDPLIANDDARIFIRIFVASHGGIFINGLLAMAVRLMFVAKKADQ